MALRRPYIVDELQYLPAPTGGWAPDGNPWEMPENQAPILDNALVRPGRIAVRGALINWADLSAITTPVAPLNVCGVQPVPGTTSLLVGRKAVSSTAYVDPWFAPIVRPATAAALAAPTADAALVVGATSFTNTARAANLIPGPRGITFEGTRLYLGYGQTAGTIQDSAATYFVSMTHVVALSSAGIPTAQTNMPRGAIDIKGYQSRIWLLGGLDDPAAGTSFNPLTLFYTIPIGPGGGNTASYADWKDPVTGFTNKITMDGDTTDPGVGLGTVRNALVIFRANSIWILRGSTPSSYTLTPVSKQVGCIDPRSIVETDKGIYFMSVQGLMLTDGVSVVNVSGAARNTLQAAASMVLGSIKSSFGGWISGAVTNGGQLIYSMGVPSVTSSAPDGHIQPIWCGMFDPATQAWSRITSQLFVADGNIVQTGNNYPGYVFNTPDQRVLSIGDKYVTQWEAQTASTTLASFLNTDNPSTAANDATVGSEVWSNPTNVEVPSDGNYASMLKGSQSQNITSPGTTGNDATITGSTWSVSGVQYESTVGTSPNTSEYATLTNWGFSIPTNATITSVRFSVDRIGPVFDNSVKMIKGGSLVGNDLHAPLNWNGIQQYGGLLSVWGVSLTPADVNASNFGLGISAINNTGSPQTADIELNITSVSISYTLPTEYLKATNYGFSIPSTATITGIQVQVGRYDVASPAETTDANVKLVKAGSIQATNRSAAATWPIALTTASFGGAADLWGTTWTPSDINNSGFGTVISANVASTANPQVDSIQITVYYTLSGNTKAQSFTQQPALYDTDPAGNFQPIPFRWRTRLVPTIGTNTSTRKIVQIRRWISDYIFQGLGLPSANGFTVTPVDASGVIVSGSSAVALPPTNNSMVASSISGGPTIPVQTMTRKSTDLFSTISDLAFDITWTDAQQSTQPSAVAAELYGLGLAYLPSTDLR